MVSESTLIKCFHALGCETPDKPIIDRCLRLCSQHLIGVEEFIESWMEYSIPLSLNIIPTLDDLDKWEKEVLNKGKIDYEADQCAKEDLEIDIQINDEFCDDDVLDIYSSASALPPKLTKRERSPISKAENDNKRRAVSQTFSPSTHKPKASLPIRAPGIKDRGKILLHFGRSVESWKNENKQDVSICKGDNAHVPKDVVYMYDMLSKQVAALSLDSESFGERLCYIWKEMGPADSNTRFEKNVMSISQVAFRTCGRILTSIDNSVGTKTVLLEGCIRSKRGSKQYIIQLDLSRIKRYSVFPGQIIAVEGTNTTGNALLANELFVKGHAPVAKPPMLTEDLKIYVAAGQFTTTDNLDCQPLWYLMDRVAEDEPNVLILIGPSIDYMHSEIENLTLRQTYNDLFDKLVARIMQRLQGKHTRVVIVSSNRDVHHDPVYPTPEYSICTNKIGSNSSNLHMMPDPCIINVAGLQIGVTSVDVIRHLGQHEVSNTLAMDRLSRLADHVLSQASFYPLYPQYGGLNFDITLSKKYGSFEHQPHIMILPSDIKHYCKLVNECLVLNPERLQKFMYARLCVRPNADGKWDPNDVSCEIAKI